MRVIPGNRRRGGAFFQMVLFVMMLTSTALMYYYFQRARALERDLAAIRRGELNPQDAGSAFGFSWLKREDANGATQATEDADGAGSRDRTSAGGTAPAVTVATERQGTAQSNVADEGPAAAVAAQDTQMDGDDAGLAAPADRMERQPTAVETAGRDDGEAPEPEDVADEEAEPEDTAPPRSTPAPAGDSLYDMTPEPVKVRAPRR